MIRRILMYFSSFFVFYFAQCCWTLNYYCQLSNLALHFTFSNLFYFFFFYFSYLASYLSITNTFTVHPTITTTFNIFLALPYTFLNSSFFCRLSHYPDLLNILTFPATSFFSHVHYKSMALVIFLLSTSFFWKVIFVC